MNSEIHTPFLQRCLDLARLGGVAVEPNPPVGAVLVHGDRIVAEGWHRQYGGPHAEVEAIRAVTDPALLPDCTLYVSLEPCSHHGKTPPCTDLILRSGIRRVVVGCVDPNPQVAGSGIALLRAAGVEVSLAADARPFQELIRHFYINHTLGRAYVTLKWAQTDDGFIASWTDVPGQTAPVRITGTQGDIQVHRLRATHAGILIGWSTALSDNPSLTTRHYPGPDPVRILLDPRLTVPRSQKLFQNGRVIVVNAQQDGTEGDITWLKMPLEDLRFNLQELCTRLLREQRIGSVLVEGGTATLSGFLHSDTWDEVWNFRSHWQMGDGLPGPALPNGWRWDSVQENEEGFLYRRTRGI